MMLLILRAPLGPLFWIFPLGLPHILLVVPQRQLVFCLFGCQPSFQFDLMTVFSHIGFLDLFVCILGVGTSILRDRDLICNI